MRGIITVLGKDRVGIIAEVCTFLAQRQINIMDLSQTIVQGFFNMIMVVELPAQTEFEHINTALAALGQDAALEIKLQREEIFEAMHQLRWG
ncbi:MAG: ACT domain-containing protein [Oscillospiraceae bacterium]|jgi:ACT domain-containing protein|nr:ACT domain-containing protein [Oscillospiraceae bacterium]